MVEKTNGKLITNAFSIIAAALVYVSSLVDTVYFGVRANFGFYFISNLLFMLGGVALVVISIVALVKFTDKASRRAGMASVITFSGIQGIFMLVSMIECIVEGYGYPGLDVLPIISLFLLVFFFIFNAKYPALVKQVNTPVYQQSVQQYNAQGIPAQTAQQVAAPAELPELPSSEDIDK